MKSGMTPVEQDVCLMSGSRHGVIVRYASDKGRHAVTVGGKVYVDFMEALAAIKGVR